jgi:AAA15 family ATPase/GTPase
MRHLSRLAIRDFGPFEELEYSPERINVFVGRNNTGKSSVLRAIDIAVNGNLDDLQISHPLRRGSGHLIKSGKNAAVLEVNNDQTYIFRNIASIRDNMRDGVLTRLSQELDKFYKNVPEDKKQDIINYYLSIFDFITVVSKAGVFFYPYPREKQFDLNEFVDNYTGIISEKSSKIEKTRLRYRFYEIIPFDRFPPAQTGSGANVQYVSHSRKINDPDFTSDEAELIKIENFIKENALVENLQRLTKDYVIYGRKSDSIEEYEKIPYRMHGDGFISLLSILHYLLRAKGGILLIEEPENHLHPQYLEVFVRTLFEYSKKLNVQVFITSHSYDLIQEILEYPKTDEDAGAVRIARLQRVGDTITTKEFSVERGRKILTELKLDLRGV